jgi:hypothetical protein
LGKRWDFLAGTLGYADDSPDDGQGIAIFYVDGVEVARHEMSLGVTIADFALPVTGGLRLKIEFVRVAGGDGGAGILRLVLGDFVLGR